MLKPVIFIVGPTASGKSKLALMLAKKLKGAIVSADSMQVYRGMDIGTAKPSIKEKKIAPHYLLDLISPRSEYSVFQYREQALKILSKIIKLKRLPIVVGGSGLYLKALRDGLSPQPGKQVQLRQSFEKMETAELYKRLKELNFPVDWKIDPNDKRRIIRALEIMESSHKSKAEWEKETVPLTHYGLRPVIFGIQRDRAELYKRIEQRVDRMLKAGWIEEVKKLRKIGFSKTARLAIGYKEILEFLEGTWSFEEMDLLIKKRSRHLAKKQLTWFRRDRRIEWHFISDEKYGAALRSIIKSIKKELAHGA